jgi:hypothetical protein
MAFASISGYDGMGEVVSDRDQGAGNDGGLRFVVSHPCARKKRHKDGAGGICARCGKKAPISDLKTDP